MDSTGLPKIRKRDRDILAQIVDLHVRANECAFFVNKHNDGLFLQLDSKGKAPDLPSHVQLSVPEGELSLARLTALGMIEWADNGQWCEPSMVAVEAVGPGRPILADGSVFASDLRSHGRQWEVLKDQGEVSDFSDDLMNVLDDICEQLCRIADALEATPPNYLEWVKESRHVSREATRLGGAIDAIQKLGTVAKLVSWLDSIHNVLGKISEAVDRLGPLG